MALFIVGWILSLFTFLAGFAFGKAHRGYPVNDDY
jgi:hypothetical protein